MNTNSSTCCTYADKCLNSPISINKKLGWVLRVSLLAGAIIMACALATKGYNLGMCIAIAIAPLPLFFIEIAIIGCKLCQDQKPGDLLTAIQNGTLQDVQRFLATYNPKGHEEDQGMMLQSAVYAIFDGPQKLEALIKSEKFNLSQVVQSNLTLIQVLLLSFEDKPQFNGCILLLVEKEGVLQSTKTDSYLIKLLKFLHTNNAIDQLHKVEAYIKDEQRFTASSLMGMALTFYKKDADFMDYFLSFLQTFADFNEALCDKLTSVLQPEDQPIRDKLLNRVNFAATVSKKIAYLLYACVNKSEQVGLVDHVLNQIADAAKLQEIAQFTSDQYKVEDLNARVERRIQELSKPT